MERNQSIVYAMSLALSFLFLFGTAWALPDAQGNSVVVFGVT